MSNYHNVVDPRIAPRRKALEKELEQGTWICDDCGCQMLDTYSTCIVCEDSEWDDEE